MFNLFYNIIKDFGTLGVTIVQFCVILFFGWKLFTNHLKHIQDKINSLCERFTKVEGDLDNTKQRISNCEGQLKQF